MDDTRRRDHLRRSANGDADELTRFIAAQRPRLEAMLRSRGADPEQAADLTQEALAVACRDWEHVRRLDNPGAWTRRVAINLSISAARRTKVHERVEPTLAAEAATSGDCADHATAMAVREAVGCLPPRARTAVVLRYFADLSVCETAARMGCAEGTVKALTHEGMTKMGFRLGAMSA